MVLISSFLQPHRSRGFSYSRSQRSECAYRDTLQLHGHSGLYSHLLHIRSKDRKSERSGSVVLTLCEGGVRKEVGMGLLMPGLDSADHLMGCVQRLFNSRASGMITNKLQSSPDRLRWALLIFLSSSELYSGSLGYCFPPVSLPNDAELGAEWLPTSRAELPEAGSYKFQSAAPLVEHRGAGGLEGRSSWGLTNCRAWSHPAGAIWRLLYTFCNSLRNERCNRHSSYKGGTWNFYAH